MTWLITALVATGVLAALLPALLLLLAVLDPPRTEEGWRRELASTGGFEHLIIADAYRIHHRKGKRKDGTEKSSRRKMATGESVSPSGGTPLDSPDSSLRKRQQVIGNDAHHHELFRRRSEQRHFESLQGSPGGTAPYTSSASSSQPADKQDQNRPAIHPESTAGESLQAGSGGRAGSLSDAHDSDFWKKLVKHGEELGV